MQQVDTDTKTNVASKISTAATLEEVEAQVQQDQKDLPAAVAANQNAGTPEQVAALDTVSKMLDISVTTRPAPVQTPAEDAANQQAADTPTNAATNNGNKKGNNNNNNTNKNNNSNGNGNGNNNN